MLLCWVMGIAQRSFMMSPQLAPTRNAGAFCLRGLGTNWCWESWLYCGRLLGPSGRCM
jgi:hypothetical protein